MGQIGVVHLERRLGSDRLDVRLGAIYALERIMIDSVGDHPTIVEVLAAFVRECTPAAASGPDLDAGGHPEQHPRPATDLQAAVTVLGRRPAGRTERGRVNLTRANLAGADLTGAALAGAGLAGANLFHANLAGADLGGADLTLADLGCANLAGATLAGAMPANGTTPVRPRTWSHQEPQPASVLHPAAARAFAWRQHDCHAMPRPRPGPRRARINATEPGTVVPC